MFQAKFRDALPALCEDVHKFSRGKVAVVAGSVAYPGAAIMATKASARAGAGFVRLYAPKNIARVCQLSLPSIVVSALPSNKHGYIKKSARLKKTLNTQDAILFGPGVGRQTDLTDLLLNILEIDIPVVIDADGILTFTKLLQKKNLNALKKRNAPVIITPHRGELKIFLGDKKIEDLNKATSDDLRDLVQRRIKNLNIIVIAKGTKTLAITSDLCLKPMCGSEVLATSGTGDVLAGTIAGMIAQVRPDSLEQTAGICASAVEVHAAAGFMAAKDFGARGALATDVCERIGLAQDFLRLDESLKTKGACRRK